MDANLKNRSDKPEDPIENSPTESAKDVSTGSGQSSNQSPSQPDETDVTGKSAGGTATPNKQKEFPVWAIVLLILVFIVTVLCTLGPIALLIAALIKYLTTSALLLPFI